MYSFNYVTDESGVHVVNLSQLHLFVVCESEWMGPKHNVLLTTTALSLIKVKQILNSMNLYFFKYAPIYHQ